jgi:hypothetical protein
MDLRARWLEGGGWPLQLAELCVKLSVGSM